MGKKLSYEQNIRAAVVFLNMFGLYIEEKEKIHLEDTLKIMTRDTKEVGRITLEEGKINIEAQTEFGLLNASYNVAVADGFIDTERKDNHKFAEWKTVIDYNIINSETVRIAGKFLVACLMDTELGIRCSCHPSLEYWVNNNKIMTLLFKQNGDLFKLELIGNDELETIKLIPFDSMNGYIRHSLTRGKYDDEKCGYPYRRYSGIFQKSERESRKLRALMFTEEYDKPLDYKLDYYDKVGAEESNELLIQMGSLMKSIDPDMYEKISYVRGLLTAGRTSLLDSFISASLEDLDDEVIEALLGIKKTPIEYGGSVKKITHIYFGSNNQFRINEL